VGKLIQLLLRKHRLGPLGAVRRFSKDPVGVQTMVLRRLLASAVGTEWGRRYRFSEILRQPDIVGAYQDRVTLHKYPAFHEDHMRVLRGAENVCWPGRFRYVATTAGTTSRGRVLPATEESIRNDLRFGRAMMLSYLAETGRTAALGGAMLTLPGRIEPHAENADILIGDMTGCIADYCLRTGLMRKRLARSRVLPERIRNITDYDSKAAAIAEHMIPKDVRMMVMMPSWGLALVEKVIDRYNATHARQVRTLGEIWPRLQLVVAGGVPLTPYRKMLEERIGLPAVDFLEVYSASEASLAFQSELSDPAMLLHLDNGVFYEFVRFDEAHTAAPRRYTVADVELGVPYLVIMTTCNGLWAYHLEDVVRFTRLFPHKLVVAGRAGELLDNFGEFLFSEEVRGAMRHACRITSAVVREFHVAPRPTEANRRHAHQWLVEFDRAPEDLGALAHGLDTYLREVSSSYASTRAKHGIGPPEIVPLPPGTFGQWLKCYRSHVIGQTKVPIMSEDRTVADTVLGLCCNGAATH